MTHIGKIHTLYFDWSGTLSDDFCLVYNAMMMVFDKLKIKRINIERFRKEFVLPYMLFWNGYVPQLSKEEIEYIYFNVISEKSESLPKPRKFNGTDSVLTELQSMGYQLGIVSSHHQITLEEEVKLYGWEKFFKPHMIFGSCHNKTEGLLKAVQGNGTKPRHMAYICDMMHDVEAAKSLGMMSIALTWGYDSREKLSQSEPHHLIDHLNELHKCLQ